MYQGKTVLHWAAENGYLAVCRLIIENVTDKNPTDQLGITPLHLATESGHLSICQLIFENIKEKNPQTESGWTPLHFAAKNGHFSVCEFIVKNVSEDIKILRNNEGFSPLDVANQNSHSAIAKILEPKPLKNTNSELWKKFVEENNQSLNKIQMKYNLWERFICEKYISWNQLLAKQTKSGGGPLHWAALVGYTTGNSEYEYSRRTHLIICSVKLSKNMWLFIYTGFYLRINKAIFI